MEIMISIAEEGLPKEVEVNEIQEFHTNTRLKITQINEYSPDLHSTITQLRTPNCEFIAPVKAVLRCQETIYVVTEYNGSPLSAMLERPSGEQVKTWGLQILTGLQALQSYKAFFLKLSLQNILLSDSVPVIADYMSFLLSHEHFVERQLTGIPDHVSPEELNAMESSEEKKTVWYFGGVLYYLLTGSFPFPVKSLQEIRAAHAQGLRFRNCSFPLAAEALLSDLLQVNPSARLSLQEARSHFFFSQFSKTLERSMDEEFPGSSTALWQLGKDLISNTIDEYKRQGHRVALAACIAQYRKTEKCKKRNKTINEIRENCDKELSDLNREIHYLKSSCRLEMSLQDAEKTLMTEAKQLLLLAIQPRNIHGARNLLRKAQVLLTLYEDFGTDSAAQELGDVCNQLERYLSWRL